MHVVTYIWPATKSLYDNKRLLAIFESMQMLVHGKVW